MLSTCSPLAGTPTAQRLTQSRHCISHLRLSKQEQSLFKRQRLQRPGQKSPLGGGRGWKTSSSVAAEAAAEAAASRRPRGGLGLKWRLTWLRKKKEKKGLSDAPSETVMKSRKLSLRAEVRKKMTSKKRPRTTFEAGPCLSCSRPGRTLNHHPAFTKSLREPA